MIHRNTVTVISVSARPTHNSQKSLDCGVAPVAERLLIGLFHPYGADVSILTRTKTDRLSDAERGNNRFELEIIKGAELLKVAALVGYPSDTSPDIPGTRTRVWDDVHDDTVPEALTVDGKNEKNADVAVDEQTEPLRRTVLRTRARSFVPREEGNSDPT